MCWSGQEWLRNLTLVLSLSLQLPLVVVPCCTLVSSVAFVPFVRIYIIEWIYIMWIMSPSVQLPEHRFDWGQLGYCWWMLLVRGAVWSAWILEITWNHMKTSIRSRHWRLWICNFSQCSSTEGNVHGRNGLQLGNVQLISIHCYPTRPTTPWPPNACNKCIRGIRLYRPIFAPPLFKILSSTWTKKLLKKYRAISGHFPVNPHHSRVSPRHFRVNHFYRILFKHIQCLSFVTRKKGNHSAS